MTLHKALIASGMTYACPAWEFAADIHEIKLKHLQNKLTRIIGNFPTSISVRETNMALNFALRV
jgi:hypothetical protein